MFKVPKHNFYATALATGMLAFSMTAGASGPQPGEQLISGELASVTVGQGFIDFELQAQPTSAMLRVSGPEGYVLARELDEHPQFVTADLLLDASPSRMHDHDPDDLSPANWRKLPEGIYHYELVLYGAGQSPEFVRGSFEVQGGTIHHNGQQSVAPQLDGDDLSSTAKPGFLLRAVGAVLDFMIPSAHAQGTFANDFVSILDTAGDNNTRVNFIQSDTGNLGIQALNGSFNFARGTGPTFSEIIMTFSTTGKVGLGTTAPSELFHMVGTGTRAAVRIENTENSYNLTTGSTTGFAIQQVKGGSRTPFRIQPGAPTSSIHVNATGNVGLGTATPATALHIRRTNGTASVLLEETQAIDINQQFTMINNGNTGFRFQNTRNNREWQFRTGGAAGASDSFIINFVPLSGPEFFLSNTGNLVVKGTVSGGSSRETKTNVVNVDSKRALEALMQLQLHEWSYINSPENIHIGPMAEDFHAMFGYGGGPQQIAPSDLASLALLAAQELIKTNRELEDRLKRLEVSSES